MRAAKQAKAQAEANAKKALEAQERARGEAKAKAEEDAKRRAKEVQTLVVLLTLGSLGLYYLTWLEGPRMTGSMVLHELCAHTPDNVPLREQVQDAIQAQKKAEEVRRAVSASQCLHIVLSVWLINGKMLVCVLFLGALRRSYTALRART